MAKKRQSVKCIRCGKRSKRVWDDERCDCSEMCYHTGYGACDCGGNFHEVSTVNRWNELDRTRPDW